MRVCVIPARGGSKRIPRKNIKLFYGQPIISFSIKTAIESDCFDRVIVSTDDKEIAHIAESYGAEVPFVRPANLSDDHTSTISVMEHAVNWMKTNVGDVEFVCCLYPTAPFTQINDLKHGFELLESKKVNYAFSATSFVFPIQRAFKINSDGGIEMFAPQNFMTRSQDLEEGWHDAGQFYWGKADAWTEKKIIFDNDSVVVKLPRYRVQDIDTEEDWIRAEWIYRAMKAVGEII